MSKWQRRLEGILAASEDSMAYTEPLFNICQQFGIHYYTAAKKERYFAEEVTRVTWAKQREEKSGIPQNIRNAFSACPTFCPIQETYPRSYRATRRALLSTGGSMSSF